MQMKSRSTSSRVTLTSFAAVKDSQEKSPAMGLCVWAKAMAKSNTAKSASLGKDFLAKAFLSKIASESLFASLGRVSGSSLRGRTAGPSYPTLTSATRKSHFGESLDLCSLRKTSERLHAEIGHCLSDLYLLEDGLLGNGPKPPGSNSLPKTQPDSLGPRVPRPISKKHSGPLLAQDLSEIAQVQKIQKVKLLCLALARDPRFLLRPRLVLVPSHSPLALPRRMPKLLLPLCGWRL